MTQMKRLPTAILAGLALALVLPSGSLATLSELGVPPASIPAIAPSCPGPPCLAVTHTTGFQVKVGTTHSSLVARRDGTIVAWTIVLGKPNAAQIMSFNASEGGPATAGIAILRPLRKVKLGYKLVAQSPVVQLEPYFGMSAQFPLASTIMVKKRDMVALTVPSWAPVLALNFSKATSWRSSRPKKQCSPTSTQTAQTLVGSVVQYNCLYQTARLTYSATLISTP
jgi:hypothetical protein